MGKFVGDEADCWSFWCGYLHSCICTCMYRYRHRYRYIYIDVDIQYILLYFDMGSFLYVRSIFWKNINGDRKTGDMTNDQSFFLWEGGSRPCTPGILWWKTSLNMMARQWMFIPYKYDLTQTLLQLCKNSGLSFWTPPVTVTNLGQLGSSKIGETTAKCPKQQWFSLAYLAGR